MKTEKSRMMWLADSATAQAISLCWSVRKNAEKYNTSIEDETNRLVNEGKLTSREADDICLAMEGDPTGLLVDMINKEDKGGEYRLKYNLTDSEVLKTARSFWEKFKELINKKVYQITYGKQEYDHFSDDAEETYTRKYRGNQETMREMVESLPLAHAVAKILEFKTYEIEEFDVHPDGHHCGEYHAETYHGKKVFRTPDMDEWEKERKEEKNKSQKKQEEKTARINQLPMEWLIDEYHGQTNAFLVYVQRTEAIYNPSYSSRIDCTVSVKFMLKDEKTGEEEEVKYIYLSDYFRKDGVVQNKKFQKDIFDYFNHRDNSLPFHIAPDSKTAKEHLLSWKKKLDNVKAQISNA